MNSNNGQEPKQPATPAMAVTSTAYKSLTEAEKGAVHGLLNMFHADKGTYVEFVTDSKSGENNHNFTGEAVGIRFKEDALPVPPKVRSGYWERVYNRAHSRQRRNKNRRQEQHSRKIYRDALLVLAKDLYEADLEATNTDQMSKQRVLGQTRGVLDEEFVAFMAQEEIEFDLAAWEYRDLREQEE